jgi:Rubisco Assembly chaperone C-terminal domain/Rubisco accumulation factor 1 alpha helical domain/Rubisco accumulation factor 1 helix turn helix domain
MIELLPAEIEELISSLRQKQGNWVTWAYGCQKLQAAGKSLQDIFEQTGFEPIIQNQITVAVQVYDSLVKAEANATVLEHFAQKGSDILYELRVLPQSDRLEMAEFALQKNLDLADAKETVKAVKEFAMLAKPDPEFSRHPGDAIAYQSWKSALTQPDIQLRTKLISRGLQFAHSASARSRVEQLLTGWHSPKAAKAVKLPIYRLEAEEEIPRLVPVVGKLPVTATDIQAVPLVDEIPPFGMVAYEGACAWVALPGWQVVRDAEDSVVILADTDSFQAASGQSLPNSFPDRPEEILILLDRAQRDLDPASYMAIEESGQICFRVLESPTTDKIPVKILGKVLLLLRQKRVLDEESMGDQWELDD